jgi:dihydroorotate dehydrogenase electron transfer subunit
MRADPSDGWIEVLFKIVGEGLRALGNKKAGDAISVIGPIGHGFVAAPERPRTLLIGGGVGIPPMIFLSETLHADTQNWQPQVIMGSEIPFPFESGNSKIPTPWLSSDIIATMPLLESWGIPTRLATLQGYKGCFDGYVTDLAREWLKTLSETELREVEVFSCGPTPMLRAVASLAQEFDVPCQVSLEEFMACAVGGCAGCAVPVRTTDGLAMKRVCVDGPVFDAAAVFPE